MLITGSVFTISLTLFVILAVLTSLEKRRSRRLFLSAFRNWLDRTLEAVVSFFAQKYRYLVRHIIQLSWYYSIHSALKTSMTLLVKAYDALEEIFISNRERAKVLRAERRKLTAVRNHLTEIEEHKVTTALTTSQKKKLKARKLERD